MHPRFGLAQALHALLAVVGSVVAVTAPAPGAALVLVAALLTLLDGLGYLHLLRRPLGTRASQNVESREEADKPGVLVIAAGYDSPRESGTLAMATRLLRDPYAGHGAVDAGAMLACCALRVAGIERHGRDRGAVRAHGAADPADPGAGGRRAVGRRAATRPAPPPRRPRSGWARS